MICNGCGNKNAYLWKMGDGYEVCNECGNLDIRGTFQPDVYMGKGTQKFENLTDKMGVPYEIRSKRHKAEVMKECGVSEAGDRVNGAPYGGQSWIDGTRPWRKKQFEKERPMIRETYKRYLDNVRRKV